MAIPFFMLAGELMNRGGITLRLVEFSQAMMGHLKGGLAHVNVLTSMLILVKLEKIMSKLKMQLSYFMVMVAVEKT